MPDDNQRRRLTRNAASCNRCGDVVESKTVHHFTTCSCGNLSVDGGLHYERRLFEDEGSWTELSGYSGGPKEPTR